MKISLLCTLAFIASLSLNGLLAQEIQSPWISTDRTVDTSTFESIVKDVIKPGMKE